MKSGIYLHENQSFLYAWIFPIWFVQGYLFLTVLLFFFGPWPWPVPDVTILVTYLTLAQGVLFIGYATAKWRAVISYKGPISAERLTKLCIIGTLIWVPISLQQNSAEIRSGGSVVDSIVSSAGDMSAVYAVKKNQLRERGEGVSQRYAIVPSVLSVMALPLGIVFWRRLTMPWRLIFIFSRVGELSTWIITGTTKGIADTFILGALMLVACFPSIAFKIKKNWLKLLAISLVCGSIVFYYFGQAKFGEKTPLEMTDVSIGISANFDNPLIAMLSPRNRAVAVMLSSYLTQGYYALGAALVAPFEWTYGFGHGIFSWSISEIFGVNGISDSSYPGRLESIGWDRSSRWHTLYTWLASDCTFPGTLLVLFLIGRLFALAWKDALDRDNPFGVVMAYLFFQMAIYMPANNQVLSFEASALAFWVCLPMWLWTRRKPGELQKFQKCRSVNL